MKKALSFSLLLLFLFNISLLAQDKKLLIKINSIKTKEVITFKYDNSNHLIYFDEKGVATYCEFKLKYDNKTNVLSEVQMNKDRGELVLNSSYNYSNAGYVIEEQKSSGKQVKEKTTDYNNIYTDGEGRLIKTTFDDGKLWEEFKYDDKHNIVIYTQHAVLGNGDIVTTNEYGDDKSIFTNILGLPAWFWPIHLNSMQWCNGFTGTNNLKYSNTENPHVDTPPIAVTYDYDAEGYPIKQFYNGELVCEFEYKTLK